MISTWKGHGWCVKNISYIKQTNIAILVCPGPSLSYLDLANLKGPGRTIFGINTTYPNIVPDVWIGGDNPLCYNHLLINEPFPKFYRNLFKEFIVNDLPLKNHPNSHFCRIEYIKSFKDFYPMALSSEEDIPIPWIADSFTMAIAIILRMGFKKIFFAGVDLSHEDGTYFDNRELTKKAKHVNKKLYELLFRFLYWSCNSKILQKNGIEFCSISPHSRVNHIMKFYYLEDLLNKIMDNLDSKKYVPVNSFDLLREYTLKSQYKDIKIQDPKMF